MIFLMAMLWMICPDMAQAQTRRTVRKPSASASKPATPKQKDDPEYKRLTHELDSLEALRDDLLGRKNLVPLAKTTFNDGTQFEVFIVRGYDDGRGQMHIRTMNPNLDDCERNYAITRFYDNGEKEPSAIAAKFVMKKGVWCNRVWGFDCRNHESIVKIELKDSDSKETKILTGNIKIEYDE